MKKLLVLAAAVAATGVANAKVTGDLRVDYNRLTTKAEPADAVTLSRYSVQTADMAYTGAVAPGVTFNTKLLVQGSTAGVDYAYIGKTLMDGLTLRAGIIGTSDGGIEDSYAGVDQYAYTHINSLVLGNAGGLGLDYVMGDHSVSLENFNNKGNASNISNTTGTDYNGTFTGIVYKGAFLDKMIKPHVSYYTGSAEGIEVKDVTGNSFGTALLGKRGSAYTAAAVGAQFAVGMGVGIDAEYRTVTMDKLLTANTTANDKYTETGFTVAAAMREGMFQPQVKYGTSEGKYDDGSTAPKNTYTTMAVGVEIVPKKEEALRYHVAYASKEQKPESGNKTTVTQVVAGIKISADFLK